MKIVPVSVDVTANFVPPRFRAIAVFNSRFSICRVNTNAMGKMSTEVTKLFPGDTTASRENCGFEESLYEWEVMSKQNCKRVLTFWDAEWGKISWGARRLIKLLIGYIFRKSELTFKDNSTKQLDVPYIIWVLRKRLCIKKLWNTLRRNKLLVPYETHGI